MNITDRINTSLQAVFNIDDPIYKALICDKDGVIPATFILPTDIDIGAVASEIEYFRQSAIANAEQLYIDQATGAFLAYTLNTYFNCLRLTGESEADWIRRAIFSVFQPRVSKAAIIAALIPYSTITPTITTGSGESGYADCSFADIYTTYTTTDPATSDLTVVFAARSSLFGASYFSITITMYGFTGMTEELISIVNKSIAAGITYNIIFE